MRRVVLALAAAALGLAGFGETTVVDGIKWRYELAECGNATICWEGCSQVGCWLVEKGGDTHVHNWRRRHSLVIGRSSRDEHRGFGVFVVQRAEGDHLQGAAAGGGA